MKIEILYPSCANLYGEATAVAYMKQCLPQAKYVWAGFAVGIAAFVIGLAMFKKNQDRFILYI